MWEYIDRYTQIFTTPTLTLAVHMMLLPVLEGRSSNLDAAA